PSWPFFLVDQHILLPLARLLVGTMDAPHPAAGPLLPFKKLLHGSMNTLDPRLLLFGVLYPADELIAPDRRQTLPQRQDLRLHAQRTRQVLRHFVDKSTGNLRHRTSILIFLAHPLANTANFQPISDGFMKCYPRSPLGYRSAGPPHALPAWCIAQ